MTLNAQFRNSVAYYDGTDGPDYHPSSLSLWSAVGYSGSGSDGNGGDHLSHDKILTTLVTFFKFQQQTQDSANIFRCT